MTDAPSNALVLAGTGKTGSRVAAKLTKLGLSVRTAARNGADVRFDWDDPTTHSPALEDVDRIYLVAPVMRMDFADQVSSFLDLAEAAGVRHVTYLSAFGIDQAPSQVAIRPSSSISWAAAQSRTPFCVPPGSCRISARHS